MTDPSNASTSTPDSQRDGGITSMGAAELARSIAAGQLSSREVVDAFATRIETVDASLNAVVVPLLDEARDAARQADEQQAAGRPLGPLHGVPITIKECFHVAGTPSCIGMTSQAQKREPADGLLVERLRQAGAVILGKTNVPLLMLCHETINPVYGRTNNPWNELRSCGGSSGGEAAIIAAGGSPLGLGSDLGGSIRQPAHACGISGIKPTNGRLPRTGVASIFRGMEGMLFQPGPMAANVEDLWLAMSVLCHKPDEQPDIDEAPATWQLRQPVDVTRLRIAMWTDDGYFPSSPAVQRAVETAAASLRNAGATVETFTPPGIARAVELFVRLMSGDGGADIKRMIHGSEIDWRLRRLALPTRLPGIGRWMLARLASIGGNQYAPDLIRLSRRYTAAEYWQTIHQTRQYTRSFLHALDEGRYDAMLFPPHALPALPHDASIDLMPAASYCFISNLLGVPAGVVPVTQVRDDEQDTRLASRDLALKRAKHTDCGSAGLPVGVQVAAAHWREDIVLSIMQAIEADHPRPRMPQTSAP